MHKTLIITILFISSNLAAQSPKVSTAQGSVIGYTESGINIFKPYPLLHHQSVLYAGRAPQDPVPWTGDKVTSEFSASPMQREPKPFSCWTEEFIAPPSPLSEDCLYLNVWTKPDGKRNLSSCGSMAEALIPVQQLVRSMRESIMRSRVSYL
ncbi:MAG: carboxylesterase family protein [Saprospiraceae bacterium]|nr:carboxylesterase family protein [Saprospiraceae bacterium]